MENARLRDPAPTSVNVTVRRRSREYLTEREVERLIESAKQNRSGHRDATAILVAYRHGLRASEVVALRWDDIDLTTGRLHVRRAKGGDASSRTRDAAPGTDGVTWQAYGENLEEKLKDLHERVHRGSYRARPARPRWPGFWRQVQQG
jgi:integrase